MSNEQSLQDFAAKMKARSKQSQEATDDKPFDIGESFRIRAKMVGVMLA